MSHDDATNAAKPVRKFQGWVEHPDFGDCFLPAQLGLRKERGTWRGKWSILANGKFNSSGWAPEVFKEPMRDGTQHESPNGWTWTCSPLASGEVPIFNCQETSGCLEGEFSFGTPHGMMLPLPISSWDFSLGLKDQFDCLDVNLHGSARLENGGLSLGGSGFAVTSCLTEDMSQKSLEVSIELKDLNQQAVGVMSIGNMESRASEFDAIVYNQRGCKQWMSCSEFFRRSKTLDGQAECEQRLLHLIATYDATGGISLFRNGLHYGTSYKAKSGIKEYCEGRARIVFGARHIWPCQNAVHSECAAPGKKASDTYDKIGALQGKIVRAALYDQALSSQQVKMRARAGRFRLWLVDESWTCDGSEHWEHISDKFPFKNVHIIKEPENRGIALPQLTMVSRYAAENCHRWARKAVDARSSSIKLTMGTLNLYDLVDWLIRPVTFNRNVASSQGVPLQVSRNSSRSQAGCSMKDDVPANCSFVELIAQSEQPPTWMISHWWGEPIIDFLLSVCRHVSLRSLSKDVSFYWICAYANRQHDLEESLSSTLEETSFFRAIMISQGVLCILDPEATPFTRIWCAFEEYVTMENIHRGEKKSLLFDVVTVSDGEASILSDGVAEEDTRDNMPMLRKADREQDFPLAVIERGLIYNITDGTASRPEDRTRILEWIKDQGIRKEDVSRRLRTFFATRAWRQCIMQKQVDKLKLQDVIRSDTRCHTLDFDFSYLFEFEDEDMRVLSEGLPQSSLETLVINLEWCASLKGGGMESLAKKLKSCEKLRSLTINLRECTDIGHASRKSLIDSLPSTLQQLHIKFHKDCTNEDAKVVAERLPDFSEMQHLHVSFRDCKQYVTSTGFQCLVDSAFKYVSGGILHLSFDGCSLGDSDARYFAVAISGGFSGDPTKTLKEGCFSFKDTHITKGGAVGLMRVLAHCVSLKKVRVALPFVCVSNLEEVSTWLHENSEKAPGRRKSAFAQAMTDASHGGLVDRAAWIHVLTSKEAELAGWQEHVLDLAFTLLERKDAMKELPEIGTSMPGRSEGEAMHLPTTLLRELSNTSSSSTGAQGGSKLRPIVQSLSALGMKPQEVPDALTSEAGSVKPQTPIRSSALGYRENVAELRAPSHSSVSERVRSILLEMMRVHDPQGAGKVPVGVFEKCLGRLLPECVLSEINAVVSEMHLDGAGNIKYFEFLDWLIHDALPTPDML